MKCLKKIIHHPQIYLAFCALLFSVFLSCGLSQDSYATSGSCSITFTINNSSYSDAYSPSYYCLNNGSVLGYYFKPVSISYSLTSASSSLNSFYLRSITGRRATLFQLTNLNASLSLSSFDISSYTFYYLLNYYNSIDISNLSNTSPYGSFNFYAEFNSSVSGSVTIDFLYTNEFGSGSSEPCPEPTPCPPIPENPYDDKLDAIKNAIYVCGASLFVIYFFVCVYKIIVKDGGSRK